LERRKAHTKIWSENLKVRSLGSPRRRWEYTVKMDLKEIGWEVMDSINFVQNRD
jgi:hypothetical protein